MKDVKSIEFIFENCERFDIDIKYFGMLDIFDIRTDIRRMASNKISKIQTAYGVVLEIFAEANEEYSCFGVQIKKKKFDRIIEWKDITGIIVKYDDDTEEEYLVDYSEGECGWIDQDNGWQDALIASTGNLYLSIVRDKKVLDFFDEEEINDKETMDYIQGCLY